MKKTLTLALMLSGVGFALANQSAFYTQTGTDPSFQSLKGKLPVGQNSTAGVKGSHIHVNHAMIDKSGAARTPIPRDINIHTLCNSNIDRKFFSKWTRWYQEDGNTQVFRLFAGETNVRNDRPLSARIEAFTDLHWKKGGWHEWQGTYTLIRPAGSIFQVKNSVNSWGVMISAGENGDVVLQHRRPASRKVIASNMIGKSFHLKVRDDGLNYEVFLNNNKVGEGKFDRPEGTTAFRWGMYLGEHELKHDAMVFVSGVSFK